MADKNKKIRILAWGDYCCGTGFGTVMRNIMQNLHATGKYEIDVLGINYGGDPYDAEKWPGKVYPAMPGPMSMVPGYNDVYGRQRLLDLMGSGDYDVVFMLQDTFILAEIIDKVTETQQLLAQRGMRSFKTVYYFPIDATPKKEWAEKVVAAVDYPVAYTKYARDQVAKFMPDLEHRCKIIYHGTNLEDFYPVEDKKAVADFRKAYWHGRADDRFLLVNINRNQPRKDVMRTLLVLKELKERGHNPLLYLHMQHSDVGGNVFVMAEQLGLQNEEDLLCPHPNIFSANQGIPIERVNMIYAAADAVITTTQGEGWGLSVTEAFATKTPVIAPDHTSLHEIAGDNRAYLIPAGDEPGAFSVQQNDMERIRPLMNVNKAADAIEKIMKGELPDIEAAYTWAKELEWKKLCKDWINIVDIAARNTIQPKEVEHAEVVAPDFMNRRQRRELERQQRKLAKGAE